MLVATVLGGEVIVVSVVAVGGERGAGVGEVELALFDCCPPSINHFFSPTRTAEDSDFCGLGLEVLSLAVLELPVGNRSRPVCIETYIHNYNM